MTRNGAGSRKVLLPRVRQKQIRENRTLVDAELVTTLVEDFRTDHVRRQHVDRELHTSELHADRSSHRVDQKRFGQPRHSLQQEMPASQEADEDAFDDDVLAHDDARHASPDLADERCLQFGHVGNLFAGKSAT